MCELHLPVSDPNEAIKIYRRHKRVTDHEVDWERTAIDVTSASSDLEAVLRDIDEADSEGVSAGVLTATLSAEGVSIGEVLDGLYDLRMEGKIHQPTDDHYSVL